MDQNIFAITATFFIFHRVFRCNERIMEKLPYHFSLFPASSFYSFFACVSEGPGFEYINNSRHLARKYARIFVRGHYPFREANSFPRAKLEENCELRGTENVQGQVSEHIFAAKLTLLCLLSIGFKNWGISSDIPQF